MVKKKKILREIVVCSKCEGKKIVENGIECPDCDGIGLFLKVGNKGIYYWKENIFGFSKFFRSASDKISKIFFIAFLALAILTLLYGIKFLVFSNLNLFNLIKEDIQEISSRDLLIIDMWFLLIYAIAERLFDAVSILIKERGSGVFSFWISMSLMIFLYYYYKTKNSSRRKINVLSQNFEIFYREKAKSLEKPVNVADYISGSARKILMRTLDIAHSRNQSPSIYHLAKAVVEDFKNSRLFTRLEINAPKLLSYIEKFIKDLPKDDFYKNGVIFKYTTLSCEIEKVIFLALEETLIIGFDEIEAESLLLSITHSEFLEKYFKNENDIGIEDIRKAILWMKKWRKVKLRFVARRKVHHVVMNRAWTARQTPGLDMFSSDITDYARSGLTGYTIDREEEIENLMRILERTSKNNALLIGEEGVGRSTIVKELANRMIKDMVFPSLADKRLVSLDIGAIIAGAKAGGDLELRIRRILSDMAESGNIILYVPDIHNMATAGGGYGFDASKILSPIMSQGNFQIIGSTDYINYHRYIETRSDFADNFDLIKVKELDEEKTIEVLAAQARIIEYKENITITYQAIKKAVEFSKKYITDKLLPGKAIDLLSEAAVEVKRREKDKTVLRDKDILKVISEKTGIPLSDVNAKEAEKLLNLEKELHKRVIGQDEAVKAVSSAFRRVRVGMKHKNRPIGVFLFLGPTGVGKTELAKALAQIYYGDEKSMIRLDMSEYQTKSSVEKLIGSSSDVLEAGIGGFLTEAVKRKPFSLILLDELEKADKNVLNLFLQVFDDGRLTDSLGRTVDFTNSIIIATSNVASDVIGKIVVKEKDSTNERLLQILEPYILQVFSPEFLNRFTAKIIFKSLSKKDIMAIVRLQIKSLAEKLYEAQGIKISLSDKAIKRLSVLGYSAQYGARFLQRTIQERVENLIAVKFLKGEIKRGDEFKIEADDI